MKKVILLAAFAISWGAFAAETNELEEAEGVKWVSVGASVALNSKYMSYGLVDDKNPYLTPSASIGFFDDWLTFNMDWLMDTTHYSRKLAYGDRQWQYFEADYGATLNHTFSAEDFEWLPTAFDISFGYWYEYHPRRAKCKTGGVCGAPDSQFVWFEVALSDLWLVPDFYYERDFIRDDGTYLNFNLSHTFALIDGTSEEEEAEPLLGLCLSVAQGFGNAQRVKGYLTKVDGDEALDHAGLMDTCLKAELQYKPFAWLTVTPYIAYYDFLFDSTIREAARWYEPGNTGGHHSDTSWHFVWGLAAAASF